MIDEFGSQDQRQRYVPQMCTMASLGSYCLTEPDAGSDAGNIKTTAVRKGDHYLLSGTKVCHDYSQQCDCAIFDRLLSVELVILTSTW
jgi:alkylation response protein AidB-like acyl-CoA dehydrogenase